MKTALAWFLAIIWPACASADTIVGQASVIDGDTIEIHGQRMRLTGIDAPESRQVCLNRAGVEYRCGKVAAFALSDRISNAAVTCVGSKRDLYRRLLVECKVRTLDLNAWMVEQGYAVAYRHYSAAYVDEEIAAKSAKLNLWAGQFQMPWDWRKQHK